MSEASKWINEVQLMRKEHEAELEKERQRSKVLVEALEEILANRFKNFGVVGWQVAEETLKKYVEMGK